MRFALSSEVDQALGMATGEKTAQARLRGKLALARDLLGMDVAMVTEVSDHQEIARYAAGEWPGLGSIEGAFIQLEETFCHKLLDGAIPNWIGDVPGDERVADLSMAQTLGVGSWIGTLVRGPDHRLYVVCALSRSVHRELGASDLRMLRTFVVSILPELAAADWPVSPPPVVSHMRRVPTTLVIDFAQPVA